LLLAAVQFSTGATSDVADVAGDRQPAAVLERWPRWRCARANDHLNDE